MSNKGCCTLSKLSLSAAIIWLPILFYPLDLCGEAIAEDPVRVHLSDQEGNPVTNATMQMQVEPGTVLIGRNDESQTLSFRNDSVQLIQ